MKTTEAVIIWSLVIKNKIDKVVLIAEVKRNPKRIKLNQLKEKVTRLEQHLKGYAFEYKGLSLDNLNLLENHPLW